MKLAKFRSNRIGSAFKITQAGTYLKLYQTSINYFLGKKSIADVVIWS